MSCALLHGFAGAPGAWDRVIAAWQLAEIPPVALPLPGHGGGHVLETWDDNLDAIAARLRAANAHIVVGYSLGARVALGLVARGHVAHAVLISVNPGIADDERPARRTQDARWGSLLRTRGLDEFLAAWEAQPLFATQARAPEAARAHRRTLRGALDAEQLARSLEVMGLAAMPDYRPDLAGLCDRIALIVGADDAKFLAIARAHPALRRDELAASGHDPTLERPIELAHAIARAVRSLREHGA